MAKALGALHRKLKLAPFLPLRKGKKTEERARSVADVIANKILNGRNYACKRIVLNEEFEHVFSKKTHGLITCVPPGDGALMDNDRNTAMCHFMALRAGSAVRAVLTFPGEKEGAAKETPRRSPRKQTAAATDPDGVDLDVEGLADLDGVELEAGSDKKGAPELPQKPLGRHSAGIRIRWIVSGFRCLHAPPGRVLSWPCTLCISRSPSPQAPLVRFVGATNEVKTKKQKLKEKKDSAPNAKPSVKRKKKEVDSSDGEDDEDDVDEGEDAFAHFSPPPKPPRRVMKQATLKSKICLSEIQEDDPFITAAPVEPPLSVENAGTRFVFVPAAQFNASNIGGWIAKYAPPIAPSICHRHRSTVRACYGLHAGPRIACECILLLVQD